MPAIDLPPLAQPALSQPAPPAPSAASAPVIVLPQAVLDQARQAGEAAAEPAPRRAERAAPPRKTETAPAARSGGVTAAGRAPSGPQTGAPVAATSPVVPAPANIQPPGDLAPVAAAQAPQPDPAQPDPAQTDSGRRAVDLPDAAIAAVLVGLAGLGVAGVIGVRNRRRRKEEAWDSEAIREPDRELAIDAPATSIPRDLAIRTPEPAPAHSFPSPLADQPGPAPAGEARQRLIDEMVAAAPDSENPFTSVKGRRKRARLILQARERREAAQDRAERPGEPFDWRTYQSPTATGPATPPLVDA